MQNAVPTTAQNDKDELILLRRCVPNDKMKMIYDALKYKYAPFTKKKFVVLKSEFREW